MAGVAMMLVGAAMKLTGPSGWPHLIVPGLVLALAGMALGVAFAAVTISARREPARSGQAAGRHQLARGPLSRSLLGRRAGNVAAGCAPDRQEDWQEWLSPLRGSGAALTGSAAGMDDAGSRTGKQAGARPAGEYTDDGWRLDGPEPNGRPSP